MPIESLSPRTPRPQYDPQGHAELPPSTINHYNVPQPNGHQPDANHAVAYHGPNYADYGQWAQYRDSQYRDNLWYEGPPRPAANLEGQYTYQPNPNIGYPAPGNAPNMLVPPGPAPGEYYIPPTHDIPGDVVRDTPQPMPDVADAFFGSVPESTSSRVSAMERLKSLSDRYLRDPNSQVHTLRMGLSPSGGRLRVVIVLDTDIPSGMHGDTGGYRDNEV